MWVDWALSRSVGIQKTDVFPSFLPAKCCQNVGWVFKLLKFSSLSIFFLKFLRFSKFFLMSKSHPQNFRITGMLESLSRVLKLETFALSTPLPLPTYPNCNRPFQSWSKPLFQCESKCKTIGMKLIFLLSANTAHFHKKGFTLGLILQLRVFRTWKWPVHIQINPVSKSVSQWLNRN